MGHNYKYYDIIDRKHLGVCLASNKRQISIGLAMGPNSYQGGKMCNFNIWLDFLFWYLEIQIRW